VLDSLVDPVFTVILLSLYMFTNKYHYHHHQPKILLFDNNLLAFYVLQNLPINAEYFRLVCYEYLMLIID